MRISFRKIFFDYSSFRGTLTFVVGKGKVANKDAEGGRQEKKKKKKRQVGLATYLQEICVDSFHMFITIS